MASVHLGATLMFNIPIILNTVLPCNIAHQLAAELHLSRYTVDSVDTAILRTNPADSIFR